MIRTLKNMALCLTALGIMSCSSSAESKAADLSPLPTETTNAIQKLVDATISENEVVGYSIGILQNGHLAYKTQGGFANIEHQVPISSDSQYQIYSTSKIFFNVALMQLIERGELDLNATFGTYLSDLPEAWKPITIHQAWSHMTGLTDIFDINRMESTSEEALQTITNKPLRFTPGTETEYTQTNFLLLKMVFEAITRTNYQDYLKDNLLAPVGVKNFTLGDTSFVAPHLTTSYEGHQYEVGKLGRRAINFPPYIYTSAGINISLDELLIWWQAVLNGQFIKKETLNTSWEPVRLSTGIIAKRSNGWERQHKNNILRVGHGGGARVHLYHYIPDADPDQSVTIIFLNNGGQTYFNHREFGDSLADIILNNK